MLTYENTTNLEWQAYSLDGGANKTIQGPRTIPIPSVGSHHIQVIGCNKTSKLFKSDFRYFSVFNVPPEIYINSFTYNQIIFTAAPKYDISIVGSYDSLWYTLDGGITNITTYSLKGTINQAAWNALHSRIVFIVFYANNSFGLEGHAQAQIIKFSAEEIKQIPGYNIYILLGLIALW